jgi:trehalose 2-sulfotransferase
MPENSAVDAYFLCATPRTGSSLVCGLLSSTGVAGRPESYFRAPDEAAWAARWGILHADGGFDYREYLRHARNAGRTDNGVFAARVMWGTMSEVVAKLGAVFGGRAGSDLDVLQNAFGATRFVYLSRADASAQAVSWLRAEQTDVWFETAGSRRGEPVDEPRFDRGRIEELVRTIEQHDAAWHDWFASVGVEPYPVHYEDLDRDPIPTAAGILDYLGIEVPPARTFAVRHRRQADELNAEWIARYRASM